MIQKRITYLRAKVCVRGVEKDLEGIVLVHRFERIALPHNPKGDPFRDHKRIAASTTSLTKTAENQGGVHRLLVVVRLAVPC